LGRHRYVLLLGIRRLGGCLLIIMFLFRLVFLVLGGGGVAPAVVGALGGLGRALCLGRAGDRFGVVGRPRLLGPGLGGLTAHVGTALGRLGALFRHGRAVLGGPAGVRAPLSGRAGRLLGGGLGLVLGRLVDLLLGLFLHVPCPPQDG
jgi:hypothetical protein